MNQRFLSKLIGRTYRHTLCRYLSVQSSVNKSINYSKGTNFYYKNENRYQIFHLFGCPNKKPLCHAPMPLCTSFYRNLMGKSEDPLNLDTSTKPELSNILDEPPSLNFLYDNEFLRDMLQYMSETKVVGIFEGLFVNIHDFTGLPWWVSIALTAFIIRTCIILPFAVYQAKIVGKLQMVSLHMEKVKKSLETEAEDARKKHGWPEDVTNQKLIKAIKDEREFAITKENCQPYKQVFLIFVQSSTWMASTLALRNLCIPSEEGVVNKIYTELSTGGFGLLADLTVDDKLILPVFIAFTNFIIIEIHRMFRVNPNSIKEQGISSLMRAANVVVFLFSTEVPSAVLIYWFSSSLYGLGQVFLLNTKNSYRLLNIPVLNTPMEKPYHLLKQNFKNTFKFRKSKK